MHIVWYYYVVYLINMVVVDGYVLIWREAINSMMMDVSHRMTGVAQCNRTSWNTTTSKAENFATDNFNKSQQHCAWIEINNHCTKVRCT